MFDLKKIYFSDWTAAVLILLFILIFTFLSFGRHDASKSYLNDLGTYDQIVWNTLHGHFFDNSANMLEVRNYLGAHFSLILLLFVPFYALIATPKWLLFFQALAVGLSALPIYWLTKEKLKSSAVALIFLVGYLFYPVLHNGLLYDFHEVVLAVAFASLAFYFLEKRKDARFIFFAILLSLSQEHLPLLVFMMGLYAAFIQRRGKFGFWVSGAALIYFFLVMTVFMPHFSSTGNSALISNISQYPSRYAWLGSSFPEILKNIVTHPLQVARIAFSFERIKYLFLLVIPTFSLAVYSWPVAIILPLIAINLLSSNPMTYSIFFYHSAILAPFIFFAALATFEKWFWRTPKLEKMFLALFLVAAIASSFIWSVTPLSKNYILADYLPDAHARELNQVEKIIPDNATLSMQHNLGPHFSERRELYRFPLKYATADYVVLDTIDPYRNNPLQLFQFEYALQMDPTDWQAKISELKSSPKHRLIYDHDGYLVFKLIK